MRRRLYTPELANRCLPLVQRIARDIQATAREIQTSWAAIRRDGGPRDGETLHRNHGEETATDERLEDLRDRFRSFVAELEELGIELKDPLTGLLDFRWQRGEQEVYLCWRLGEDAVAHWHTLDGGFAGRRPLADHAVPPLR
jgi:hypothetical protein